MLLSRNELMLDENEMELVHEVIDKPIEMLVEQIDKYRLNS